MSILSQKINELIESGWNVRAEDYYVRWRDRVTAFLERATDSETAGVFRHFDLQDWESTREAQIGMLEGLIVSLETQAQDRNGTAPKSDAKPVPVHPRRLFIVHGHDTEAKETVARFTERLGLESIILHEQPNSGRTIIEKFEIYADVGFAVVLLTPDDLGAPASRSDELKGRARQNVILELGYFLGKLTRRRVCALYKSGVEIPSDYQGVLYVELDPAGAWRTKLAQELVEAGFSINLEALLKS
jgi:predicted nucleotide-binding protein